MTFNHGDFDGDRGSHRSFEWPGPSLDGLRVLVIEDNALVRAAMECMLTSWGCRVTLADGALMACDQVRHDQAPDIILSDYQLNDGYNGINAIHLVRELADSKIPACLISADSDGNLWQHAEAAGAYFLRKPVPPAKVLSMLSSLLLLNGGDV
jgi:CheY-like chemotaxis protein